MPRNGLVVRRMRVVRDNVRVGHSWKNERFVVALPIGKVA
jgi:hypothetical protein